MVQIFGSGCFVGSPYRDLISEAILKLQEDQILQMLYNKWWKQKGTKNCEADNTKNKDANALAIANVGGVFVVLVAGLLLGLIVAFAEFIYKAHKNADIDRVRVSPCRSACWGKKDSKAPEKVNPSEVPLWCVIWM